MSIDGGSSIIKACRACLDTKEINYVQFNTKDGIWNELYLFCFGFSVSLQNLVEVLTYPSFVLNPNVTYLKSTYF